MDEWKGGVCFELAEVRPGFIAMAATRICGSLGVFPSPSANSSVVCTPCTSK